MRRTLLTLACLLFIAETARADIGPPWPGPGTKAADVAFRLETREDTQNYVFVLHRGTMGLGLSGLEYVQLDPSRPLLIDRKYGHRREWAYLLVIARTAAEPYKTVEELFAAVVEKRVPVVVREEFNFDVAAVPTWAEEPSVFTYELRRPASGEGLEIVRTSWHPLWQWFVAVILFTLAILFGGFRLARRFVRRGRAKSAT